VLESKIKKKEGQTERADRTLEDMLKQVIWMQNSYILPLGIFLIN